MSANSDSKNNAELSGMDLKRALDMMDALLYPTLTSGQIVAENTTITTNFKTSPEQKPTDDSESVLGRRDIFFSRGHTGWE